MNQTYKFTVSSSPHIRANENTRTIMLDVIIALVPALLVAIYVFGLRALLLTCVSIASAVFWEWLYCKLMKQPNSIGDLSAIITGMLLAFCMPANAPVWLPVLGTLFSIVLVKKLYGGLGKNFLNPALGGRAFLLASWPVLMTAYMAPISGKLSADVVTSATPLVSLAAGNLPETGILSMLFGNIGGSLGEVSALALLVGGIYLVARKVISPRIPLSFILTVAALTFIFPRGNNNLQWMAYNVLGGGVMLGAIFMATDYATSPVTKKGQIIFGIGCGLITVFIRYFGSYPEGVSYAILVMNICVWLIDKATGPRRFGVSKADLKAAKARAREEKKKAKGAQAV